MIYSAIFQHKKLHFELLLTRGLTNLWEFIIEFSLLEFPLTRFFLATKTRLARDGPDPLVLSEVDQMPSNI